MCKQNPVIPEKLIGFGCDGTDVNIGIGDKGLRRKLEIERPWFITTWCMAHSQLTFKDEQHRPDM